MKDLNQTLTEITEICIDGNKGYATAAKNLANTDMQTMFNRLAQQRKLFVEELKLDARTQGFTIEESGSFVGFFHRAWIDTKAFFSSDKIDSVIESAIEGETSAIDVYQEAINMELPEFIRERLKSQLSLIKVAVNQLHGLKTEAH